MIRTGEGWGREEPHAAHAREMVNPPPSRGRAESRERAREWTGGMTAPGHSTGQARRKLA